MEGVLDVTRHIFHGVVVAAVIGVAGCTGLVGEKRHVLELDLDTVRLEDALALNGLLDLLG